MKLLAAATVAVALVLAPAAPASAATSLTLEVGYAASYVPGQPVPVRVQVAADRLVSGELQIVVDGVTTAAPVEVPGGSEKEFLVVVPTANRSGPLNVVARLPDGSKTPPSAAHSVNPVDDQEVVGLLPGALAGRAVPGPAALSVDVGTARFVALGPAELDRAPDSVRALATIGVGADELGRQAPSTRTGLLQWVEAGGRLLVDAAPGATVAGLPDAWQPGSAPRVRAGAGEIRLTSGAMGAGRWTGLIEPTARPAADNSLVVTGPPLGDALAREAGFRLPHLSWLVGFLAAYVVIVGPLLFVLLRRQRRPELAWVVIPLVAVVFTGASWAGGRNLRSSTQIVHGTVLSTGATGTDAITYLGVSSRSGGTQRIGWPTGWLGGADALSAGNIVTDSVRLTPAGPESRIALDANQFALVSGRGPVAGATGALEVTAIAAADGQARGVVRNGTRLRMESSAVFTGSGGIELGALEPGESREWNLQVNPNFGGRPAEAIIVGSTARGDNSFTNLALWDVAQRAGLADRDPGQALAVGWTTEFKPAVKVGGTTSHPEGRTLVLGRAPVSAEGPRAADLAFPRDVVRTIRGTPWVYRFAVPSGNQAGGRTVEVGKLMLRSPTFPVEVWTGDTWTPISCGGCVAPVAPGPVATATVCPTGALCFTTTVPLVPSKVLPVGGGSEAQVPAGAVRDGFIYVRFPQGGVSFSGDTSFAVREAA